jgi:hypothetical protein
MHDRAGHHGRRLDQLRKRLPSLALLRSNNFLKFNIAGVALASPPPRLNTMS